MKKNLRDIVSAMVFCLVITATVFAVDSYDGVSVTYNGNAVTSAANGGGWLNRILAVKDTVDQRKADYGSWVRACSSLDSFVALDSGYINFFISGLALLRTNDQLFLSIDSLGGASDTGLMLETIEVLKAQAGYYGTKATPFQYTWSHPVDSADSVNGYTLTFATQGGRRIALENVSVSAYFTADSGN